MSRFTPMMHRLSSSFRRALAPPAQIWSTKNRAIFEAAGSLADHVLHRVFCLLRALHDRLLDRLRRFLCCGRNLLHDFLGLLLDCSTCLLGGGGSFLDRGSGFGGSLLDRGGAFGDNLLARGRPFGGSLLDRGLAFVHGRLRRLFSIRPRRGAACQDETKTQFTYPLKEQASLLF